MKILGEKELCPNNSIDEIKDLMLYRVMLFIGFLGIPVVLVNVYFALDFNLTWSGAIHAFLLIPVLIMLLFYRRFSYRIRVNMLIDMVTFMGAYNFYLAGFSGAGLVLFLTVVGFAVLFLRKKQAIFRIVFCIVIMAAAAYLYISETVHLLVNTADSLRAVSSWIMATVLFGTLSTMFLLTYTIIEQKLIYKIQVSNDSKLNLEDANRKLIELLEQKEIAQKELMSAKLRAEESNQLKTEFLHNMSHEVRTPLNGIMGFSRLLKKEDLSHEKRVQFSDIIVQSSEKLQKVIDDILEISFLETKQITVTAKMFNVFSFLNDLYLVFLIGNRQGVDIKMLCPKDDIFINTDQHKLHKILSNLIENALKFTENGYVEFGFCEYQLEGSICFYVKDTGIGISEENIDKIFSRFTQESKNIATKYGGLGLGLCIAKENTILLGGTIKVESQKDKGTVFYVEIPTNIG